MSKMIIIALLATAAQATAASTPGEWSRLERAAKLSCIAASNLSRPTASDPVVFNDATGLVAILVSGSFRQTQMRAARGTSLCLYDRKSRTATIEEAIGWDEFYLSERHWRSRGSSPR
jgi:hypothetical protein